jgi:hypothetical protein
LAEVNLNIVNFLDHCRNPEVFKFELFSSIDELRDHSVPRFFYNTNASIKANFSCLAKRRQWVTRVKMERWIEWRTALFESLCGCDTTKLEIWQELCRECHVNEPPSSITQCRRVKSPFLLKYVLTC